MKYKNYFFLFLLAIELANSSCEYCFLEDASNTCKSPYFKLADLFSKVILRENCESNELFLYLRVANKNRFPYGIDIESSPNVDTHIESWLKKYMIYDKKCTECCKMKEQKCIEASKCQIQLPDKTDFPLFEQITNIDSIKEREIIKVFKSAIKYSKKLAKKLDSSDTILEKSNSKKLRYILSHGEKANSKNKANKIFLKEEVSLKKRRPKFL